MTNRETMLDFAYQAILGRAAADGYQPNEYDPASDNEGYVVSLLTALHHWTHAHGFDWTAELNRAQELFQEDLDEYRNSKASPFPE